MDLISKLEEAFLKQETRVYLCNRVDPYCCISLTSEINYACYRQLFLLEIYNPRTCFEFKYI